jgi:hypothetical protein
MKLQDAENFKAMANFISFCLVVVGLILQSYLWLVAALALRSTTISIVVYRKDSKQPEAKNLNKGRRKGKL